MTSSTGPLCGTFSSPESRAMAIKLIGNKPMAAARSMSAVDLNSLAFFSIHRPVAASDQVKNASNAGMIV